MGRLLEGGAHKSILQEYLSGILFFRKDEGSKAVHNLLENTKKRPVFLLNIKLKFVIYYNFLHMFPRIQNITTIKIV